jgi:ATP-dependent RNA helicase RhlE
MPYFNNRSRSSGSSRRPSFGRPSGGGKSNRRKEYIHPSRFVQAARPSEQAAYEPTHSFHDFGLEPLLQKNLEAKGILTPSAIQDQAIVPAMEGRDVVGIANTGTGKTIAFALPMLQKLLQDPKAKALIMAPTRELAQQIEDECRELAKGSGLLGALLIGGTPMRPQLKDLSHYPRIVIGTPGRIKDHIERRTLAINTFNIVVLDEVDRMLDMGFVNDMREILKQLATPRQSFFFSATLEPKVSTLIQSFTDDVVTVSVKTGETSENVEQDIISYNALSDKIDSLHNLLNREDVGKTLVFDETQRSVERLSNELISRGFAADAIHGGKSQGQRQRALSKFKNNDIKILVATDVAARGIDVSDITHVVNYAEPQAYEDYVHRIGRAGRAGRKGYAFTFVKQ